MATFLLTHTFSKKEDTFRIKSTIMLIIKFLIVKDTIFESQTTVGYNNEKYV